MNLPLRVEPLLYSERLVMRPLTDPDYPEFHALFIEPGVRRYLCDDKILPEDVTRGFLERSRDLLSSEGAGLWGIRLPNQDALLGVVGYWYFHELPRLELLYALSEKVWHRGYASEAARCMIDYGRRRLKMTTILASCDTPNLASIRVLERLGFVRTDQRISNGRDTSFFSLPDA
jgi:ribosomal-protein-alanine N-acetyltransferase